MKPTSSARFLTSWKSSAEKNTAQLCPPFRGAPLFSGSATVPVAPVGVPLTGSSRPPSHYYKRRLPHFERPWAKYMASFATHERRTLSPRARDIVLKSLLFGHEQRRYQLYAACVMPDHVHFLFEPQIKGQDKDGNPIFWSQTEIFSSIKSFTAHEINKAESQTGHFGKTSHSTG